MRFLILTFCCLCFIIHSSLAQSPKRELRAAWIATVSNIDFPSKQGLPSSQQQQEFMNRLDQLKRLGCNAVIVQIRPAADAFYASLYEPWSRFLTGKQGQPPFPYYDPLSFMIEQTHLRNMEFHAWFNPYRALTDSKKNPNPPDHITRRHPDWIISYGGKSYINPGEPAARDYVVNVIADVVKRYDIDGVHLDDYFYPYRIAGVEFGDYKSYAQHGKGFSNKEDWRRNNVDVFVEAMNMKIKQLKPYVKFGISPFGVWRNASKDPRGSETRGGQTCYDDLYSDILLWLQHGWIDYVMPQLYWEHYHRAAPFEVLLPWWEKNSYGRHVYYGLGVYRMLNASAGPWATPNELLWQLKDIRTKTATPGYSLYSASNFDKIRPALADSMENKYAKNIAFPPVMKWIDSVAPAPPIVKFSKTAQGILLSWDMPFDSKDKNLRYAIYRFVNNEPVNLNLSSKIIGLQSTKEFADADGAKYAKCTYVITALDRLWNESKPSEAVEVSR
ncbi:MAG TPA: family 10 glycosylhydrolase [Flavipsychrobacter sp.]|nr:family 10 glycosylhydrolase [Flavipsychrobacter sp.]